MPRRSGGGGKPGQPTTWKPNKRQRQRKGRAKERAKQLGAK